MSDRVRSQDLNARKQQGIAIVVLTCYDYPTALWQDEVGVDVIFCADSVGTNLLGYQSEKEVTIDDMVHHLKAVRRGVKRSYLLADLPYGSCDTVEDAMGNSLRFLSLGADGVKLEGFKPEVVCALRERKIDVWCHLGLNPQIHREKRLKAKTAQPAVTLIEQSEQLQRAGASFLVLEAIPEEVGQIISRRLRIPTIGIAAGRHTDGQVLVVTDLFGVHDLDLRHANSLACFRREGVRAIAQYAEDVRSRRFPGEANVFHMKAEELESLQALLSAPR
ncbi:MAG: 3-methyl-2-oxobutanoate hydroxymethyltransferase [Candidatus Latescibacterota bacterium]|nr:3-methyl-2-oxobutanoate hydroxymethyltransferase [Candidatus Latescibacterota bacterium]